MAGLLEQAQGAQAQPEAAPTEVPMENSGLNKWHSQPYLK